MQVFDRPPKGVRKIVIATNIAETRWVVYLQEILCILSNRYAVWELYCNCIATLFCLCSITIDDVVFVVDAGKVKEKVKQRLIFGAKYRNIQALAKQSRVLASIDTSFQSCTNFVSQIDTCSSQYRFL